MPRVDSARPTAPLPLASEQAPFPRNVTLWGKKTLMPNPTEVRESFDRSWRTYAVLNDLPEDAMLKVDYLGQHFGSGNGMVGSEWPVAVRDFKLTAQFKQGGQTRTVELPGQLVAGRLEWAGNQLKLNAILGPRTFEREPTKAGYHAKQVALMEVARQEVEREDAWQAAAAARAPRSTGARVWSGSANDIRRQAMGTLVEAQLGASMKMAATALNPFDPKFWSAWMGGNI